MKAKGSRGVVFKKGGWSRTRRSLLIRWRLGAKRVSIGNIDVEKATTPEQTQAIFEFAESFGAPRMVWTPSHETVKFLEPCFLWQSLAAEPGGQQDMQGRTGMGQPAMWMEMSVDSLTGWNRPAAFVNEIRYGVASKTKKEHFRGGGIAYD